MQRDDTQSILAYGRLSSQKSGSVIHKTSLRFYLLATEIHRKRKKNTYIKRDENSPDLWSFLPLRPISITRYDWRRLALVISVGIRWKVRHKLLPWRPEEDRTSKRKERPPWHLDLGTRRRRCGWGDTEEQRRRWRNKCRISNQGLQISKILKYKYLLLQSVTNLSSVLG